MGTPEAEIICPWSQSCWRQYSGEFMSVESMLLSLTHLQHHLYMTEKEMYIHTYLSNFGMHGKVSEPLYIWEYLYNLESQKTSLHIIYYILNMMLLSYYLFSSRKKENYLCCAIILQKKTSNTASFLFLHRQPVFFSTSTLLLLWQFAFLG